MTVGDPIQLGMQHHRAGRFAEAEAIYRAALARNPNDARPVHLLGTIALQQRNFPEAVRLLRQASTLAPNVPEIHFTLGDALRFSGDFPGAEAAYRKALGARPLYPQAHNALGLALVNQHKLDAAILSWQRAIQLKPDYAEPHANLGAALAQQKKFSEAAAVLRKAIALNPSFAPAHNNLANVLEELDENDEAVACWQRAVELNPNYFDALVNLAKALQQRAQHERAMQLLDRAVALRPDDADARFLRGLGLLLRGDLQGGFADYQFRTRVREMDLQGRSFPQPAWDGTSDLAGRTILLHAEQGLGDTIQFARYAAILAEERGARVIVECSPDLVELLRTAPGVADVVARNAPMPAFDAHASLMSLPSLLGTTVDTIPRNVPYLSADPARAAAWRTLLAEDPPGRRVGLVWSGNPKHANDRNRSIPLRYFEPLASVPGVTFFSLQKGPAAGQMSDSTLMLKLIDHAPRLTDFAETAAMLANLDLVITVDTAVAHVAGAIARPAWLLLPFVPDWRWMLDREDSPWYPTMRLFRQRKPGDWSTVIERVVSQLPAGIV